jgi:hypothetical protein
MPCKECGSGIPERVGRKGRPTLYCSDGCRIVASSRQSREASKRRYRLIVASRPPREKKERPIHLRTCAVCQTRFKRRAGKGICCSRDCGFELLRKQIRERAKAKRESAKEPRVPTWAGRLTPVALASCLYCRESYLASEQRPAHGTLGVASCAHRLTDGYRNGGVMATLRCLNCGGCYRRMTRPCSKWKLCSSRCSRNWNRKARRAEDGAIARGDVGAFLVKAARVVKYGTSLISRLNLKEG